MPLSDATEAVIPYWHEGVWKTGDYDPATKIPAVSHDSRPSGTTTRDQGSESR